MIIYTVQSGDTLGSIAQRFGVPANRIAADNQITDLSSLVVGQSLVIPSNTIRYVIREGQTLFSVSQEFGVPLEELLAANPDINPIDLRIGDTVLVPAGIVREKVPAVLNGYAYPTINPNALNCSIPFLTVISPFSYTITPQGELIPPDDSDLIYRSVRSAVMPLMVVTNIFDGSFSTETLSAILGDPELTQRLTDSILFELGERGYYGLNLDMEYIAPEDRDRYNAFLLALSNRLHERGYVLFTAVAPKVSADQQGILYESHDYAVQGRAADYVILMTYEWGYTFVLNDDSYSRISQRSENVQPLRHIHKRGDEYERYQDIFCERRSGELPRRRLHKLCQSGA